MFSLKNVYCYYAVNRYLFKESVTKCVQRCFSSKDVEDAEAKPKLNKAMKAYLERARSYNEFITKENQQFKNGTRHLANIMGLDPEAITQQQIDESIEYLFPSGLFEKKARPMLKPPMVIFPPRKDAQFDETGRPFHFLFYTGKPNFYGLLHDMVQQMHNLNVAEDNMLRKNKEISKNMLDVTGSEWLSKQELENLIVEPLSDLEYKNFLSAGERLLSHSLSALAKDVITKYRKSLQEVTMSVEAPKPEYDETGRTFVTVKNCPRKCARADVTVRSPGTGLISINGKDIEYFSTIQSRNQVSFIQICLPVIYVC
ncbi:hypothetical protein O3M35_000120 [Rhynocoris fuscipes]|uniref:28S ribosomal protein S9, mitochondrial n=1 Tax=Rhynocoris fuscipes TaxID=488301 RepID=A0AAW1DME7_9HEMI